MYWILTAFASKDSTGLHIICCLFRPKHLKSQWQFRKAFINCHQKIYEKAQNCNLKGTVSRDFQPLFFAQKTVRYLGPIWKGKIGFANIFISVKNFIAMFEISCPRIVISQRPYGHVKWALGSPYFQIFELLLLVGMNTLYFAWSQWEAFQKISLQKRNVHKTFLAWL